MGVYYKIACDDLRECVNPGDLNNLGVKLNSIAYPGHPFGLICVFAMSRRWSGRPCRIVDDAGEDPGYFEYADVTEQVVKEYNDVYEEHSPVVYTAKMTWEEKIAAERAADAPKELTITAQGDGMVIVKNHDRDDRAYLEERIPRSAVCASVFYEKFAHWLSLATATPQLYKVPSTDVNKCDYVTIVSGAGGVN